MQDCHGVNTPMDINQKLSKLMSKEHVSPESPNFPYQEAIGTLLYLSQTSRPDICFEASFLSSFNQEPKGAHIKAVKRVMRYIQGTKDAKIAFDPDSKQGLVGYCDSDWANNVDNRRSVSGYIFMFQACQKAKWLRSLIKEIDNNLIEGPTVIYCNNKGAIDLAKISAYKPRTKHIDIKYHFIRECIDNKEVRIEKVPTEEMFADFLTKPLNYMKLEMCCEGVNLKTSD
ncbi:hypothetical protein TKK_0007360 [Trichogramma kaykai]